MINNSESEPVKKDEPRHLSINLHNPTQDKIRNCPQSDIEDSEQLQLTLSLSCLVLFFGPCTELSKNINLENFFDP